MTFTEERIFEIRRVDSHSGIKVLYTPFPITREFIPRELNVYSLIKKINGGFFVGEITAETNLVDFGGTIISAKKFTLGENVDIVDTHHLSNINDYMSENVSKMRIFVIQPMHGKDLSNFDKEMAAIRLLVAKHFGRNIDDIEMIDQLHVDDPYDIDGNFSSERERRIYRLTRSMRMLSTATHAVAFIQGESAPGCDVEMTTCRKYKIPMIHIDVLRAFQRITDPDVVDALATIDAKLKGSENNDFLNMASYLEESHFPLTHPLESNPRFIKEEY
jgi:hypothetical protein